MVPVSVSKELAGAAPAPPPLTNTFAVSSAEEAIVLVALKYGTPPEVPTVNPVPPCRTVSAALDNTPVELTSSGSVEPGLAAGTVQRYAVAIEVGAIKEKELAGPVFAGADIVWD